MGSLKKVLIENYNYFLTLTLITYHFVVFTVWLSNIYQLAEAKNRITSR